MPQFIVRLNIKTLKISIHIVVPARFCIPHLLQVQNVEAVLCDEAAVLGKT